jgi:hypothetical protein
VDANVPVDVRHIRGRRNRVVLARPCRRQARDDAFRIARVTVAKAGSPRRARISRKTTAQGGPVVTACTCGHRARANLVLRGGPGCSGHPALPAPSAFRGWPVMQNSGACRENVKSCRKPLMAHVSRRRGTRDWTAHRADRRLRRMRWSSNHGTPNRRIYASMFGCWIGHVTGGEALWKTTD